MFRDALSYVFTVINVVNIASLVWFLVEIRTNHFKSGGMQVAAALMLFFTGLMVAQVYSFAAMQYTSDGGTPGQLTPWWPLFVVAVVCALGGGAWLAWLFRPRRVPLWVWVASVATFGVALAGMRWAVS